MGTAVDALLIEMNAAGNIVDGTAERKTAALGNEAVTTSQKSQKLTRSQRDLSQASGTASSAMGRQVKMMGAMVAGTFSIIVAFRQLASTVTIFADFEFRMGAVQAVTSSTSEQMVEMTDVARSLGRTTRFAASEAAAGMEFLGRAGFKTHEVIAAIPGVLDLAASSAIEMGEAADITSNVLSGFGLNAAESNRVADILAGTAASANTTVSQLGQAFRTVAPLAASLGIEMETAAATIGALGNAGIQGAHGGEQIKIMLRSLIKPTSDMKNKLKELHIPLERLNPVTHELTDILGFLRDKNLSASDAFAIFGRAGTSALAVINSQLDPLKNLESELKNNSGQAKEMAGIMNNTLRGSLFALSSAVEAVKIDVGTGLSPSIREASGLLRDFATGSSGAATAFGEDLGSALTFTIRNFDLLIVAIKTLLVFKLATVLTTWATGFDFVTAATARFSAALKTVGLVGWVTGAVGLYLLLDAAINRWAANSEKYIQGVVDEQNKYIAALERTEQIVANGTLEQQRREYDRLSTEIENLTFQHAEASGKAQDLRDEMNAVASAYEASKENIKKFGVEVANAMRDAHVKRMERYGESVEQAEQESGKLSAELHRMRNAQADLTPKIEEGERALIELGDAAGGTADDIDDAAKASATFIERLERINELIAEGNRLSKDRGNDIADGMPVFDDPNRPEIVEVNGEIAATVTDITDKVEAQREAWWALGESMAQSLAGGNEELSRMITLIFDAASAYKEMAQAARDGNSAQGAMAGGQFGAAVGQFGTSIGLGGRGNRGTGQFGGQLSGDYADVGAEIGGTIGGAFGPIWGAIGSAAGLIIGGMIKIGADHALAEFSQVGADLQGKVIRAEGDLGDEISEVVLGIVQTMNSLEQILGQEIIGGDFAVSIADDIVRVFINGAHAAFEGSTAIQDAIAFSISELLRTADLSGLGENTQAALNSGRFQSLEEIEAVIALGRALDEGLDSATPMAAALLEIAALRKSEIELAQRHGLAIADVLNLGSERLAQLGKEAEALLASSLGVTDHLSAAKAFEAAVNAYNSGLERERLARETLIAEQDNYIESVALLGENLDNAGSSTADLSQAMGDAAGGLTDDAARLNTGHKDGGNALDHLLEGLAKTGEIADETRQSLEELPAAIDTSKIAEAFQIAGSRAAQDLIGLLQQVHGEQYLAAELQLSQGVMYQLQLAAQISSVANLLAATDLLDVATRELLTTILDAAMQTLGALQSGDLEFKPPSRSTGGGGGSGGYLGGVQSRQDARGDVRRQMADLEAGLSDMGQEARGAAAEIDAMIEHMIRLSTFSEEEQERMRRMLGEELLADFMAPVEEFLLTVGETDLETQTRHLKEFYAGQREYLGQLLESAAIDQQQYAAEMANLDLAEQIQLARLLADAERELADERAEAFDAMMDSVEAAQDLIDGVFDGDFVRRLAEVSAQFGETHDALAVLAGIQRRFIEFQAGIEATGEMPGLPWMGPDYEAQLAALEAAQARATQAVGFDFIHSLEALGVALPIDLVLELAEAEFNLAKASAIAAATALFAAGAFENLSISFDEFMALILAWEFDPSTFLPPADDPSVPKAPDGSTWDEYIAQVDLLISTFAGLGSTVATQIQLNEKYQGAQDQLNAAVADGIITAEVAANAWADVGAQAFATLAQSVLGFIDRWGVAFEGYSNLRARLEEVQFRIELENLRAQYEALVRFGLMEPDPALEQWYWDMINNPPDFNVDPPQIDVDIPDVNVSVSVESVQDVLDGIADWILQLEGNQMHPAERALRDLNLRFEEFRDRLIAAGGSLLQLADLEAAVAAERARILEESLDGIRDLYESLLPGTVSSSPLADRLLSAQKEFERLSILAAAGDFEARDALAGAGQHLLDLASQMFGSTAGFFDIQNMVRDTLGGILGIGGGDVKISDFPNPGPEITYALNGGRDKSLVDAIEEVRDEIANANRHNVRQLTDVKNEVAVLTAKTTFENPLKKAAG